MREYAFKMAHMVRTMPNDQLLIIKDKNMAMPNVLAAWLEMKPYIPPR
jgi:hypothetical protein